jgi:PmbA protein
MTSADLLNIGDRIVGWAHDGEQVEAVVVSDHETEVRVYEGEIESYTSAASQGVGVRVIVDDRQGFAYAGSLDDDVLAETLAEARDNAGFGTVDEALGLAEPDGVAVADLDLFNAELAEFPNESKIDMALELEKAVRAGDPRIKGVESAEYVDVIAAGAVVSNTGIRTSGRDSACYIAAFPLAEQDDETQSGFGFSVGRDPNALDLEQAAADAVDRATRLLGASKPASERVTVVFDPWVTAQFLGIVGSTLSGEAVLKGRSLFAGRLDDEVGATVLTLVDDPTNPAAFSATETDGEGLATRRNVLLEDGVLRKFLHNSYTARRTDVASTGSAVRGYASTPGVGCMALSLVPGTASQQELIADVGEGILVQGVAGLHSGVNPVSGDFSTGAEGLRISGGALGEPLREFTIASTIQRMLLDVVAVGGDLEWLPMAAAGVSLVVSDVTVSGD